MIFSPIALFVYNRPEHTRRMLNSLLINRECENSPITVYCDGAKSEEDLKQVKLTRKIVHELLPKAIIIENEKNFGIAESIINGVTEQCKKYGRVIVIEDDLLLSPVTLEYFNKALDSYKDNDQVMHIASYTLPVKKKLPASYFSREASCWGWATWKRAWDKFEPDSKILIDKIFKNRLIKKFNMNHSYLYWEMLIRQHDGLIDSWAIRWYGSVFINNGLSLNPGMSLVKNTGFDGTGSHCNVTDIYDVELSETVPTFPDLIEEKQKIINKIIQHRNGSFPEIINRRMKHYIALIRYLNNEILN